MDSKGRIEVAPEVIVAIAHQVTIKVEGVSRMGSAPTGIFRRNSTKADGIQVHYEADKLVFDIHVLLTAGVNLPQTSKAIQAAIIESMDQMVGVPVEAVNIHVDDVAYTNNSVEN